MKLGSRRSPNFFFFFCPLDFSFSPVFPHGGAWSQAMLNFAVGNAHQANRKLTDQTIM